MSDPAHCPCDPTRAYAACCGSFHAGSDAAGPEALMRSRFSAFALGLDDYLLATWHASTRPASLAADGATRWVRLDVVESDTLADRGRVHFRATFRDGRRWGVLEEDSRFVCEAGRWYYLDGNPGITRLKPGRNDPCPCGSGRKSKLCHGA